MKINSEEELKKFGIVKVSFDKRKSYIKKLIDQAKDERELENIIRGLFLQFTRRKIK